MGCHHQNHKEATYLTVDKNNGQTNQDPGQSYEQLLAAICNPYLRFEFDDGFLLGFWGIFRVHRWRY